MNRQLPLPNQATPKMHNTMPTQWHAQVIDELLVQLGTSTQRGLSAQDATERLAKTGLNELRK